MIKTPRELALFLSALFSLLIACAAWGTTFMMWYDDDKSERKTAALWAAFRAALIVFTILMLIALAVVLFLPKLSKS